MAPKKRMESPAADLGAPSDAVPEEEEDGPGRVTFSFTVAGVSNLPCELETMVKLEGPIREKRSGPAAASSSPSGFEFEKTKSIRKVEQALLDDIVGKPLTISLLDTAAEFALIGKASLDFVPLLHDQTEIGGDLKMTLSDSYYAKWFPEPDPAAADDADSPARSASPRPAAPVTTIAVTVSVLDLIAPVEDRGLWTILTMDLKGFFALPPRMTECGNTGPDDIELHLMKYQVVWLGETLNVALTAPAEKPPEPAPAEPGADGAAPEEPAEDDLPEDEWRSRKERFGYGIRFKDGQLKRYRGSKFINEFRYMLNHVGGTWLYFTPEEKPSTDPKKPNPPEVASLVKHYYGKAWCDLRDLINPGTRKVDMTTPLLSRGHPDKDYKLEEPTLESSRSYARLALELSCDAAPPKPAHTQVPVSHLVPPHEDINRFPSSGLAARSYVEAVQRSFDAICNDCVGKGAGQGGVPGLVQQLKQSGTYGDTKQDLRNAIVCVFRERLRKDTGAVPGRPLTGAARDQFFSDAYAYLKGTMVEVLDEFRKNTPMPEGQADGTPAPEVSPSAAVAEGSTGGSPGGRSLGQVASDHGSGDGVDPVAGDPVIAALAETEAARHSREALGLAADPGERCARLAYEAEMVGNWDRAARLFQNRLLLEGCRRDPKVWIEYAKFCMRARGRQSSAEEALRQAVQLLAEGEEASPDVNLEVDLMLACLLLDRGRHDEAIRVFKELHEKDFGEVTFRFLLGLSYYLTSEEEAVWRPMLMAVSRPRDWFEGLPNNAAVADKLRVFRDDKLNPVPYAGCLEMLLDFGLPSLVFTFLDQCAILPKDLIDSEPIALVDAKASALDRDWQMAINRLEPLLANRAVEASQEAWRLAGECHFQMQNFEQALQDFQHALQFERKFEDPAVYIRWGHVLLLKKRWKQAREAFLRSIQYRPTAEAWSCVGHAEYRSEDRFRESYEALREANLLDNERWDVWAQLCLIHLREKNAELAEHCFRQCVQYSPESDELLLEVATECIRREMLPAIAEAASRIALQLRDSWQGHASLADAFAKRGEAEKGVLEAQIAIRLAPDQPDQRKAIFERAVKWAEDVGDPALSESLHAVQKFADQQATELERMDSSS